jgi:HK97 family phage prohead protease
MIGVNGIKQLAMPLQAASLDEVLGTGSGYLSVFDYVDKQQDAVVRGAFLKTLEQLEADRRRRKGRYLAPLLWQHSPYDPCGGFTVMREDSHGLYVEFELDMTIELGRRAYSALKKSYVGGLSIGYRTIRSKMLPDGVRALLEVELLEGSVVTFPSNDMAIVPPESMKHGVNDRDAALALIATMKGVVNAYKNGAGNGQRSNETMNDNPRIYYNRQYGQRQAAHELDLPERIVRQWYDEAASKGELSHIGHSGTWGMSGYDLAQKCNEHALEIYGAWIAQGKAHDGIVAVTSTDNRALNAAFLAAIPEGNDRDLRSDKEAPESDYEQSKFRLLTDVEAKAARKSVDTRFAIDDSDDDGYQRPLMNTRDLER